MIQLRLAAPFSIHMITASGAALALLSLLDAAQGEWERMFFWFGIALIVDAVDGPLARRVKLWELLPRWSGETLDLVVDFVTYVFVPAYAIAASGLLPPGVDLAAGIVIVVTSALYFADRKMKTEDNYFRGFPAIWNLAAFYLFLIAPSPWQSVAFVAVLALMSFLPIPFIHPLRVVRHRRLNVALMVLWSALASLALMNGMAPGTAVTGTLCVLGLYILGGGFLRGRMAD